MASEMVSEHTAPQRRTAGACNFVDADYEPFMPHLSFSEDDLNKYHPSIEAPDDVDDGREYELDNYDGVFQHGLELVEDIKNKMESQGRRRCEQ